MVIIKKVRILFFTKYGTLGASSKYRSYQYIPYIENNKINVEISELFTNADLERLYNKGSYGFISLVKAFFRRIYSLLFIAKYDLIIIEYELFPYFPPIFEFVLKVLGKKYIVDYDDAIFHNYDLNPNFFIRFFVKNKIGKVIKNASAVITGNQYLFDYASMWNNNVRIIPTVLDVTKYDSSLSYKEHDDFVIGWIGSPSTSKYLLNMRDVFQLLNTNGYLFRLKFIGADKSLKKNFTDLDAEWIEWNENTEVKEIKSFSVGIMPLEITPWTKGKCGFKLIQYMACEIPVIATPVGINKEIVIHGKNGFLAETVYEWYDSILKLMENKELRKIMGVKGKKIINEKYSLEKTSSVYLDVITSIIN